VTWADRAATGLRAVGQPARRADRRDCQVQTQQEPEIARLAAAGLSNKQIAGRLFMSHRTVGSHLYRIFPKLGITSQGCPQRDPAEGGGLTGAVTRAPSLAGAPR
jgi:DNA-binding NarL/FixJ family response regulator